jgi:hypothetical protein
MYDEAEVNIVTSNVINKNNNTNNNKRIIELKQLFLQDSSMPHIRAGEGQRISLGIMERSTFSKIAPLVWAFSLVSGQAWHEECEEGHVHCHPTG